VAPGRWPGPLSARAIQDMLPLVVFLLMSVPFVWAMFLAARLGLSMRRQRIHEKLYGTPSTNLFSELFRAMPEAAPRIRRILLWFGVSVIWWIVVMVSVGLYVARLKR
jgi:hypothetical protein